MSKKQVPFAHLHCHSDKSFLDGVGRPIEYVEMAQDAGQTAIALTDHGNLYGLPDHRRACQAAGIKPIYGMEAYLKEDREVREQGGNSHLVVLARNQTGWRNLLRLNHDSVRNGYYYYPRITTEVLLENCDGLIVTTACLQSQFAQFAREGRYRELRKQLGQYKDAIGEHFYTELHFNEAKDQHKVNAVLLKESKRLGIKPIVACDVHYACACDVCRQDEMIAVARRKSLNDPDAFKLDVRRLWFQTPKDIWASLRDFGYSIDKREFIAACARTAEIADGCDADIYGTTGLRPPKYIDSKGRTVADGMVVLSRLAKRGLHGLGKQASKKYRRRLRHELDVIDRCGMADFYLVTMDVVSECRRRGIIVWTRGSGCASLAALCVGITTVDPIRFGLLFERFVDPNRANAPDFDLDIDATRRAEIVEWLTRKYGGKGGERIAKICAIATFGLKGAIRDVGFAYGVDNSMVWSLSRAADQLDPSVEKSLIDQTPNTREDLHKSALAELHKCCNKTQSTFLDTHSKFVNAALTMVGRARARTQHAAGYVVAPGPLVDYLPIDQARDTASGEPVIITSWGEGQASQDIGDTGLMKLDLLALDTVTVVSDVCRIASERHSRDVFAEVNTTDMDFRDEQVLREFASGNGFGLHQLNQTDQTLATLCQHLKPKSVRDVIAAIALYRPGSMDFLDEFVKRAHGRAHVEEVHPIFDEVTRPTYGILVYQEQIMAILNRMGGIELREAYQVIKLISKKKKKEIEAYRDRFVAYASDNGASQQIASQVFGMIEKFAGYGFNQCVSGDTLLFLAGKNASNPTGTIAVSRAYEELSNSTALGKKMRSGRWRILQMDADRKIRPGFVKNIYCNGYRDTVCLRLANGIEIRATANHRLLTDVGYKTVAHLCAGDKLVVMGEAKYSSTKISARGEIRDNYNPDKGYGGFPVGRNNPAWGAAWLKGRPVYAIEIVCICSGEKELVYDVEMDTVGHNFVANQIVSHNSHSTSYGLLSWVTAYLRAYYPLEFWWGWLNRTPNQKASASKKVQDRKIELMMRAAARSGIKLYPPSIGLSSGEWQITSKGALRAPLSIIMGVGVAASNAQHEAFNSQQWRNVWDFLAWAEENKRTLNKGHVEKLALGGAFRTFRIPPERAMAIVEKWNTFRASKTKGTKTEQLRESLRAVELLNQDLDEEGRIGLERRALGFSYWRNPWSMNRRSEKVLELIDSGRIAAEDEKRLRGKRRAFRVLKVSRFRDRRGRDMAFVTLEAFDGTHAKGVCFSSVWKNHKRKFAIDSCLLIRGEYQRDGSYIVDSSTRNPVVDIDSIGD